jgi:diaminopimelate decarboxylase
MGSVDIHSKYNWDYMQDMIQKNILYTKRHLSKKLKRYTQWEFKSIDNLSILEQFGTNTHMFPYVLSIRYGWWKHNISVGHIDSKFGISIHQLPHLVRIVENTKMNIVTIHAQDLIFLILKCSYA